MDYLNILYMVLVLNAEELWLQEIFLGRYCHCKMAGNIFLCKENSIFFPPSYGFLTVKWSMKLDCIISKTLFLKLKSSYFPEQGEVTKSSTKISI